MDPRWRVVAEHAAFVACALLVLVMLNVGSVIVEAWLNG